MRLNKSKFIMGFTLIEMMVVVGITSILGTVFSTLISQMFSQQANLTESMEALDIKSGLMRMLNNSQTCTDNLKPGVSINPLAPPPASISLQSLDYYDSNGVKQNNFVAVGQAVAGASRLKVGAISLVNINRIQPQSYSADLHIVFDVPPGLVRPKDATITNLQLTTQILAGSEKIQDCSSSSTSGGSYNYTFAGIQDTGNVLISFAAVSNFMINNQFHGDTGWWCANSQGFYSSPTMTPPPPTSICPFRFCGPASRGPASSTPWAPPQTLQFPKGTPGFIAADPLRIVQHIYPGGGNGTWTCSQHNDTARYILLVYNRDPG